MKTKMWRFSLILMFVLLTLKLYSQTAGNEEDQRVLQKKLLAETLKNAYHPQSMSLWDSGNGLICKYTSVKGSYMIRYDKQGKYVETLLQKEWNDTATLHPVFQLSPYKSQKVTGYWEVSDIDKDGYYLEMLDGKNNISRMWVDGQGVFSVTPYVYLPKE